MYDVKKNLEEKDLLEQEVKLSQVIAQLRLEEKEKMQEEIKQLKQILVTPRYHFKKIEDNNYETLLSELNELKQRMGALGIKPEDLQVHRANLAILNINNGSELQEVKSALKEANKRDITLHQADLFSLAEKIA